jgi:hypothetical protein
MKSLNFDRIVAHDLRKAYDMGKRLDMPPLSYAEHFWGTYDTCSKVRLKSFVSDMDFCGLHEAMSQLIEYATFLEYVEDSGSELEKSMEAMTLLISKQVRMIVEHSDWQDWMNRVAGEALYDWNGAQWLLMGGHYYGGYHRSANKSQPPGDNEHHWKRRRTDDGWENMYTGAIVKGDKPVRGKLTWKSLSPLDLCTMSQSILLNLHSASFCLYLGHEKHLLEKIVTDVGALRQRLDAKYDAYFGTFNRPPNAAAMLCEWTKGKLNDEAEFEPLCPAKYECVAQIPMPKRLSDPKHWGHLAWMFCSFMDALAAKPKV